MPLQDEAILKARVALESLFILPSVAKGKRKGKCTKTMCHKQRLPDQKSNASTAACAFAPKLATATLMIPDQIIGAAA